MRALVIGADGFAGRWLLRHLVESGDEVVAAVGPRYAGRPLPSDLEPRPLDVRDADAVRHVVGEARPEVIYYLAGISRAGDRERLDAAVGVSVHGALNVLTAAAAAAADDRPVRLLHVGSSHMYAAPPDGSPITEESPIRPSTVYGAVKAAAESALVHLAPASGVDVVAIRAFNHIGPGQDPEFVVPSLARQVVAIRRGEQEPVIRAGDFEVERDFTDVRDIVRAYRLIAMLSPPSDVVNVATGHATSVRRIAEILLEIHDVDARLEAAASLTRQAEARVIVGDARHVRAVSGWEPTIELRETLDDVLLSLETRVADPPGG